MPQAFQLPFLCLGIIEFKYHCNECVTNLSNNMYLSICAENPYKPVFIPL
jgi:hypothetical protein